MNCLAIFVLFITLTKAWDLEDLNVTIALMEYQPIEDDTFRINDRIIGNTAAYREHIKSISDLDMIIFPECTLRANASSAVELTIFENPCDKEESYELFIHDLSCAARDSNTYVVVNLVQKVKCETEDQSPNCQNYGSLLYNTNVVFDRNGTIVALYHKYNLFGEKPLDRAPVPEEIILETDFGLKFGIFTCFDILFKRPAQNLVTNKIDAIIYPTQWHSELPFLTAIQVQQMWSYTHNVKLFAAGSNNPQRGNGGSGFFNGAADSSDIHMSGLAGSFPLIYSKREYQKVSTDELDYQGRDMDSFLLHIDPYLEEYGFTILDIDKENFSVEVCHRDGEGDSFCCNFTIRTTTRSSHTAKNVYTYHLVAFSGVRSFAGFYNGGLEVCAVIACLNSSLSSCGQRFLNYNDIEWPITFEEITIRANFESDENRTQYPNSLLSSIKPIDVRETLWGKEEVKINGKTMIQRIFSLNKSQDRLLTFAIYGRDFNRDSPADEDDLNNFAQSVNISWFFLIYISMLILFESYYL